MKKWSFLTVLILTLSFFAHQAQAQQNNCDKSSRACVKQGKSTAISQLTVWAGSPGVASVSAKSCDPSNCKPTDCCLQNCLPGQCTLTASSTKNIKLVNVKPSPAEAQAANLPKSCTKAVNSPKTVLAGSQ